MFNGICTSKGYVFEPDIILEYLFIGLVMFFIYLICKKINKSKKINEAIGISLSVIFISLIPMTFFACHKLKTIEWEKEIYNVKHLVSLKDNNITELRGIKRINVSEKTYYQLLYTDGNSIRQSQIPAHITQIRYSDNNFRIESYELERRWLLWWQVDEEHILYLPIDSISSDFSIDLE